MYKCIKSFSLLFLLLTATIASAQKGKKETTTVPLPDKVWAVEKAQAWYDQHKWITGANYIPANAINQLEMWQAASFDPATIDKELGWAESIGFNTLRIFLHDKLWQQDADGFKSRINIFLSICARHHIKPMAITVLLEHQVRYAELFLHPSHYSLVWVLDFSFFQYLYPDGSLGWYMCCILCMASNQKKIILAMRPIWEEHLLA